jgi:hypothetical protein
MFQSFNFKYLAGLSLFKFENLLEGVEKIRNRESLGKIAIILE